MKGNEIALNGLIEKGWRRSGNRRSICPHVKAFLRKYEDTPRSLYNGAAMLGKKLSAVLVFCLSRIERFRSKHSRI